MLVLCRKTVNRDEYIGSLCLRAPWENENCFLFESSDVSVCLVMPVAAPSTITISIRDRVQRPTSVGTLTLFPIMQQM